MEGLQQSKVYQKEQKRQFKELKELVRRHQKKTSELLREINNKYKKTARQCSKSRYQKVIALSAEYSNPLKKKQIKMAFSAFMSLSRWNQVKWCVLLWFISRYLHQKLKFKQWERWTPPTAERRAAAAAPGSEAGAVLQSEISTERTHQNGKNQKASNSSLLRKRFSTNRLFRWRLWLHCRA